MLVIPSTLSCFGVTLTRIFINNKVGKGRIEVLIDSLQTWNGINLALLIVSRQSYSFTDCSN